MEPPVRPPRLRCGLFPSIYLPHLLVLPATFGLQRLLPPYPYFPALYVVPVRQARGLPSASSRFHLTMDTLAVQLCASSLPTRTRDFHPLESAHVGRTKSRLLSEKNKRLIWQRYVILHLLYRGAHHFEQKFVQAAGVPVFPEHGVAQVVEALDDNAVFRRGKKYL